MMPTTHSYVINDELEEFMQVLPSRKHLLRWFSMRLRRRRSLGEKWRMHMMKFHKQTSQKLSSCGESRHLTSGCGRTASPHSAFLSRHLWACFRLFSYTSIWARITWEAGRRWTGGHVIRQESENQMSYTFCWTLCRYLCVAVGVQTSWTEGNPPVVVDRRPACRLRRRSWRAADCSLTADWPLLSLCGGCRRSERDTQRVTANKESSIRNKHEEEEAKPDCVWLLKFPRHLIRDTETLISWGRLCFLYLQVDPLVPGDAAVTWRTGLSSGKTGLGDPTGVTSSSSDNSSVISLVSSVSADSLSLDFSFSSSSTSSETRKHPETRWPTGSDHTGRSVMWVSSCDPWREEQGVREVLQYLTYRTRSARHAGCDQSLRPVIQKQKNREISKKSDKIHLKRCHLHPFKHCSCSAKSVGASVWTHDLNDTRRV